MRKALILGLGFLSSLLFIVPARYIYVCKIMNNCASTENVNAAIPFNLSLMDGDSILLQGYQQLAFDKGSITPNLTPNNQDFLNKIVGLLKANPDKNLTITGKYRASEAGVSSGIFENLGLARANAIRDLLVKRGIDINRISLDHAAIEGEAMTNPITFDLFSPTPDEFSEDGSLVKAQFRFDNMTFSDANFEFNSDVFKPGAAFNVWADSVITFFDLNPDKTLDIIGHTDNVGTITYNQDLGLRRANSAKAFFEEKGVESTIRTSTRGEKSPIASNLTNVGRQKNRRVNFVIQ